MFGRKDVQHLEKIKVQKRKGREVRMRIAIGSDHAGFFLKENLKEYLKEIGVEYKDFGTHDQTAIDYPDIGFKVANAVAEGSYDRGILICGTGIGMSIVANKVKGIRASLCENLFSAYYSRQHNDANILTMGAWKVGSRMAKEITKVWLETSFSEEKDHVKRIKKIP